MAKDGTRSGFIVSSILHVGFFGLLALFIFLQQFVRPPEPIILELVSPPGDALPQQPTQAQAAPDLPEIAPPQVESVKTVEFSEIPDPPPPEPTPPPPEPTPPPPQPTPPKPKPETPKPTPKPEPKPEPPTQRMSISDFRKEHKVPTQTTVKRTVTPTPKPAPKIDTSNITASLEDILESTSTSQMSQAEQNALRSYIARLRQQIEIAWDKPALATSNNEWVQIVVTVLPNGRISGHRVVSKSGGAEFLRSVDRAVANARSIGPTPNGQTLPVKFTLRLREE